MIEIKNLNFKYLDKEIFKDLNLTFSDGQKYAIVGESGSGKTTLLYLILNLLEHPGSIINDDSDTKIVFQEDRLIENISLFRNIKIANNEISKQEIINNLESLSFTSKMISSPARLLSGGERKKVSIIRAVISKPKTLILDEPFNGIDNENKKKIYQYILEKCKDSLIIIITHHFEEYAFLKPNVISLKN